ncbi:MAG: ATP-binding protein [Pseudomonadota bacterium]
MTSTAGVTKQAFARLEKAVLAPPPGVQINKGRLAIALAAYFPLHFACDWLGYQVVGHGEVSLFFPTAGLTFVFVSWLGWRALAPHALAGLIAYPLLAPEGTLSLVQVAYAVFVGWASVMVAVALVKRPNLRFSRLRGAIAAGIAGLLTCLLKALWILPVFAAWGIERTPPEGWQHEGLFGISADFILGDFLGLLLLGPTLWIWVLPLLRRWVSEGTAPGAVPLMHGGRFRWHRLGFYAAIAGVPLALSLTGEGETLIHAVGVLVAIPTIYIALRHEPPYLALLVPALLLTSFSTFNPAEHAVHVELQVIFSTLLVAAYFVSWATTQERHINADFIRSLQTQREMIDALDRADVGMALVDRQGIIQQHNKAALRLLGHPEDTPLLRSPIAALWPSPDDTLTRTEPSGTRSIEHIVKVGQEGPDPHLFVDVTAESQAREKLDRMEASLREARRLAGLGEVAGRLAHEVSNLLQPILSFSQLADTDNRETRQRSLAEVTKNIAATKATLTDVLDYARGGQDPAAPPKSIEAGPALREAHDGARSVLPPDTALSVDLDFEPLQITVPPDRIRQILINLYKNAADASQAGEAPRIALRAHVTTLAPEKATALLVEPGRFLAVTVADRGIGIPKAMREQVFEPFFTTKPLGEGTGLGLSVVYGLMRSWGGGVSVHGDRGQGTTIILYFPVAP